METKTTMLNIYLSFILFVKFKSYTLFYDDHDIQKIDKH
jgi:hypothetical protein